MTSLIELRQAPDFVLVPGVPHVVLLELRQAPLISYQDDHMSSLIELRHGGIL